LSSSSAVCALENLLGERSSGAHDGLVRELFATLKTASNFFFFQSPKQSLKIYLSLKCFHRTRSAKKITFRVCETKKNIRETPRDTKTGAENQKGDKKATTRRREEKSLPAHSGPMAVLQLNTIICNVADLI
jgi:hypothetical protein